MLPVVDCPSSLPDCVVRRRPFAPMSWLANSQTLPDRTFGVVSSAWALRMLPLTALRNAVPASTETVLSRRLPAFSTR
ncbi:hypothetical protein D3C83_139260 [compost metagenome]